MKNSKNSSNLRNRCSSVTHSAELQADGSFPLTANDWIVGKGGSLPLKMEAKIPKQTVAGDKGKIATVSYTLGWVDSNKTKPKAK